MAPESGRLGVGRRLVRWLIDRERKSGIKEILLWVIDGNAHARNFYFRMGFRSTGRIQPVPGREKRTEELLAYVIGRWGFRHRLTDRESAFLLLTGWGAPVKRERGLSGSPNSASRHPVSPRYSHAAA